MTTRKRISIFAAMTAISLGLSVLSGCIWIPTFGTLSGKDAGQQIGDARSKRPISTGIATEDDVYRVLGNPAYRSENGQFVVYFWERQWTAWFWPLCFATEPADKNSYALEIEFDAAKHVVGFERHSVKRNLPFLNIYSDGRIYLSPAGRIAARDLIDFFGPMRATNGDPATRPTTSEPSEPLQQGPPGTP